MVARVEVSQLGEEADHEQDADNRDHNLLRRHHIRVAIDRQRDHDHADDAVCDSAGDIAVRRVEQSMAAGNDRIAAVQIRSEPRSPSR